MLFSFGLLMKLWKQYPRPEFKRIFLFFAMTVGTEFYPWPIANAQNIRDWETKQKMDWKERCFCFDGSVCASTCIQTIGIESKYLARRWVPFCRLTLIFSSNELEFLYSACKDAPANAAVVSTANHHSLGGIRSRPRHRCIPTDSPPVFTQKKMDLYLVITNPHEW